MLKLGEPREWKGHAVLRLSLEGDYLHPGLANPQHDNPSQPKVSVHSGGRFSVASLCSSIA